MNCVLQEYGSAFGNKMLLTVSGLALLAAAAACASPQHAPPETTPSSAAIGTPLPTALPITVVAPMPTEIPGPAPTITLASEYIAPPTMPEIVLGLNGRWYPGDRGSFTWPMFALPVGPLPVDASIPGPTHADAIPPDPDYTIDVSSDDRLTVEIFADGPPETLYTEVFVSLREPPVQTLELEPDTSTPIDLDLPNGTYMVIIHGTWFFPLASSFLSHGGISYAFRINVRNAGSPLPEDPREAAALLMEEAANGDWGAVRSLMTTSFQDYDIASLRLAMAQRASLTSDIWPSLDRPEHWQVDAGDGRVVVRSVEYPDHALTFRKVEEGFRFDPGPAVRVMADWYDRGLTLQDVPILDVKGEFNSDSSMSQFDSAFDHNVLSVDVNGEHVVVSIEWEFFEGAGARVALENLLWEAGAESGAPELLWTTAMTEDNALTFPGSGSQTSVLYLFTLGLDGVPDAEELTLIFDDITIDSGIELSMRYTLPLRQFP